MREDILNHGAPLVAAPFIDAQAQWIQVHGLIRPFSDSRNLAVWHLRVDTREAEKYIASACNFTL